MQLATTLRRHVPPASAGLALIAAHLVSRHLRFDAADPLWPDRDRVVASPDQTPLAAAIGRLAGSSSLFHSTPPALGCGVGMALAERLLAGRFGRSLVDHRSWVLCDGAALASGAAQEAAWLAGAWRLGRLTVLADNAPPGTPGLAAFALAGWTIRHADAADAQSITAALSAALRSIKPTLIACSGQAALLDDADDAPEAWLATGRRLAGIRRSWLKRLARHAGRAEFEAAQLGRLPPGWHTPLSDPGPLLPPHATAISTAAAIRAALPGLAATIGALPILPGDPAWPPPANQTDPPPHPGAGRLALGMGAVLCGAALHGGAIPLCIQPGSATDSLLPGLRAAAAADARTVLLLTGHTSDAATTLNTVPNLAVFRPADASEAMECLELAIRRTAGPSVLLLCDTPSPLLADRPARTHAARGFYLAAEPPGPRAVTLLASGPQLHIAMRACAILTDAGIDAAVVSAPCPAVFAQQDAAWRARVLDESACIAIGPGTDWLGRDGPVIEQTDPAEIADRVTRYLRRREAVWTGKPRV